MLRGEILDMADSAIESVTVVALLGDAMAFAVTVGAEAGDEWPLVL